MNTQDTDENVGDSPCPPNCPRCGRPRTIEGQPSRRWFYGCGSYLYEGDENLRDRTEICEAEESLNAASDLLVGIMRDEVNPQHEAEKWLRAYAPEYLTNTPPNKHETNT